MSDIIPVTKADLLAKAAQALSAQQRLREVMAGVAAEVKAGKALGASAAPAQGAKQ